MKNLTNDTVIHVKKGEVELIQFRHLLEYGDSLAHCFTCRNGGISTGCYSSLNMGFGNGDSHENVFENYRRVGSVLGINTCDCVFSRQIHGDNIRIVRSEDAGKGFDLENGFREYDGFITDVPGIPMVTFHADCIPIFLYDPVKNCAGIVHSGWRGTVRKIGKKAAVMMNEVYGSDFSSMMAGIGPAIGYCCFEVDRPVVDEFVKAFSDTGFEKHIMASGHGKWKINLAGIIRDMLIELGLKPENVKSGGICTRCNPDVFFSHRAHGGNRGSLAAIMQLK